MTSFLMVGWSKIKGSLGVTDRKVPLTGRATSTDATRFIARGMPRPHQPRMQSTDDHYERLSGRAMLLQSQEHLDVVDGTGELDRESKTGWAVFVWVRMAGPIGPDPFVLLAGAPREGVRGDVEGTPHGVGPARFQLVYDPVAVALVAEFWPEGASSPSVVTAPLARAIGDTWQLVGLELGPYDSGGTTMGAQTPLVTVSVDGLVASGAVPARMALPDSLGDVLRVGGRMHFSPGSQTTGLSAPRPAMEFAGLSTWRASFNPMRRRWMTTDTRPESAFLGATVSKAVSAYLKSRRLRPTGLWLGSEGDALYTPNRIGAAPLRLSRPRSTKIGPEQ